MGGGSERERELLGEMISNKMPVFRNIGPLATAFGWLFLPPNYILIKYCLSFDSSTKKSTFKVPAVISGLEGFGLQAPAHEHLGVSRIVGFMWGEHWFLWGRWCQACSSDDMGYFVWPGLLDRLLCASVLGAASCCASWNPKNAISLCTHCWALHLGAGMSQWLDGCIQILHLGTGTVKSYPKY